MQDGERLRYGGLRLLLREEAGVGFDCYSGRRQDKIIAYRASSQSLLLDLSVLERLWLVMAITGERVHHGLFNKGRRSRVVSWILFCVFFRSQNLNNTCVLPPFARCRCSGPWFTLLQVVFPDRSAGMKCDGKSKLHCDSTATRCHKSSTHPT
jgi:hypothetical protein